MKKINRLFGVLLLFAASCSSDFKYRQQLTDNLYIIKHESFSGYALATVNDEDYFNVLQLDVIEVWANDSLLILADTADHLKAYKKLLIKPEVYKEDLVAIDDGEYQGLKRRIPLKYDFNGR